MASNLLISNYSIIIKVYTDKDFIKYNSWFFKAKWKDVVIEKFESFNHYFTWKEGIWEKGLWKNGLWKDGLWQDGIWEYGTWINGLWKNGTWQSGTWENGIWEDGDWESGLWEHGKWEHGRWKNGIWKNGIWKNGKIWHPTSKKYRYSKISPKETKWSLSYGK